MSSTKEYAAKCLQELSDSIGLAPDLLNDEVIVQAMVDASAADDRSRMSLGENAIWSGIDAGTMDFSVSQMRKLVRIMPNTKDKCAGKPSVRMNKEELIGALGGSGILRDTMAAFTARMAKADA